LDVFMSSFDESQNFRILAFAVGFLLLFFGNQLTLWENKDGGLSTRQLSDFENMFDLNTLFSQIRTAVYLLGPVSMMVGIFLCLVSLVGFHTLMSWCKIKI
jgi:hypothetical protein